jgi:DNA polymerase V
MDEVGGIYLPSRSTRLSRPLFSWLVPAGFPSPAECYVEGRIDLNRDLIKHPLATFFLKVTGDSMEPLIHPGSFVIVDRMVETRDGDIVVARIGAAACVKRLSIGRDGRIRLLSENKAYEPIEITEEMDFEVRGRVMWSFHRH